jgi:hypothetical protein
MGEGVDEGKRQEKREGFRVSGFQSSTFHVKN